MFPENVGDQFGVTRVAFDKLAKQDGIAKASAEIVEDDELFAHDAQLLDNVAANIAGPASD